MLNESEREEILEYMADFMEEIPLTGVQKMLIITEAIRLTEEKMDEKKEKAMIFVAHIDNHLVEKEIPEKVMCKICHKDIDQIYEEEIRFKPDAQAHAKGCNDSYENSESCLRIQSSHDGIEEKGKAGEKRASLTGISCVFAINSPAPKLPDSESENIDKLKERIAELEYDLLAYRRPTNVRVIDVRKDERRKVLEEVKNKIKTYSPTVEYHNNCMIREQLLSLISELEEKR